MMWEGVQISLTSTILMFNFNSLSKQNICCVHYNQAQCIQNPMIDRGKVFCKDEWKHCLNLEIENRKITAEKLSFWVRHAPQILKEKKNENRSYAIACRPRCLIVHLTTLPIKRKKCIIQNDLQWLISFVFFKQLKKCIYLICFLSFLIE